MAHKLTAAFPSQSILYFLICGAGILVFILLIIIPAQKNATALDQDIKKLKNRIEEQRILTPVFQNLLKKVKRRNPAGLPAPKKAKLSRGDIDKLAERFQAMAARHNLKLEEITPDINSLASGSGALPVRLKVSGDFLNFRGFLIDLGAIAALQDIQQISILAGATAARQMKLNILLARK